MSGRRVLLDSVILIDHLNGIDPATRFISERGDRAHVSAITRAEVLAGCSAAGEPAAIELLDRFPLISIDAPIADLAARLRREHSWKLPDALQAAAALTRRLNLATRNHRHFSPERYDFIEIPYSV